MYFVDVAKFQYRTDVYVMNGDIAIFEYIIHSTEHNYDDKINTSVSELNALVDHVNAKYKHKF